MWNTVLVAQAHAQEIIVNPSVSDQDISRNALRAIFGMRLRQWPDGAPIRVFVLPDKSPIHVSFSKKKLQIFPHQIRQAWDRLVYSGTGQAPIEVASEEEMREKVGSTRGAIGYLRKDMIDDRVRAVQVQ